MGQNGIWFESLMGRTTKMSSVWNENGNRNWYKWTEGNQKPIPAYLYTVSQKSSPFYFCDYSVICWPILIIFLVILQLRKFAKKVTYSFSYNIRFVHVYYKTEKEEIFCMLSMTPLRLVIVPVSCSFFKSLLSPCSPRPLFGNFLRSFVLLHNLLKRTKFLSKFHVHRWNPCLHQITDIKPLVCYQAHRVCYRNK